MQSTVDRAEDAAEDSRETCISRDSDHVEDVPGRLADRGCCDGRTTLVCSHATVQEEAYLGRNTTLARRSELHHSHGLPHGDCTAFHDTWLYGYTRISQVGTCAVKNGTEPNNTGEEYG